MINILPDEGRSTARRAYLLRLIVVVTFAGAFVALAAGALLFPSYLQTMGAADAAKLEAARLTATAPGTNDETDAQVALAQSELATFKTAFSQALPSKSIEEVLSQRGSGITLNQIQYDSQTSKVSVGGTASTRENLLTFVQHLRKAPDVVKVDLPVNDLAKNENASFSLTVFFTAASSTPPAKEKEQPVEQ